jgi:hypothetical protein
VTSTGALMLYPYLRLVDGTTENMALPSLC